MSFTETVGHPATGNLVLQHKEFKKGKWDLDYRAHKRVVRVLEREDSSGSWKLDPDATGDLVLGLCWPNDKGARELPMWSFGFPVVITSKSKGGGVATPGGANAGASFSGVANLIPGGTPTQGGGGGGNKKSGQMNMLPIADQKDSPDGRMNPIPVPPRVLKAKGPQAQPPPPPGAGGGGGPGGINPNRIDSGGSTLILGIGGSIGGFGGQGVGTGSSFPTFGGVKTNFGGSGFPGFGGVRTNFSGGSPGATFTDPAAAPKGGK